MSGAAKQQPGTPLPWKVAEGIGPCVVTAGDRMVCECFDDGEVQDNDDVANVAYVIHAANAYPKLVGALRKLVAIEGPLPGNAAWGAEVTALLRELGEEV